MGTCQLDYALAHFTGEGIVVKSLAVSVSSRLRNLVFEQTLATQVPVAHSLEKHGVSLLHEQWTYLDLLFQMLYYVLGVAFIIPLILMSFSYARVGVTLYRSVKEAGALTGGGGGGRYVRHWD